MTRLSRRQALLGGLTLAAGGRVRAFTPALAEPAEPLAGIDERIGALERTA